MSAEVVVSSPDVLVELRAATGARHHRLETLLDLTGPLPLERYAAVLRGFLAFVRPWEAQVLAALPERLHAWWAPRRRAGLIADDLAALGLPAPDERAPEALALRFHTAAEVFGSLYVMEGSTLGGQVISAHLRQSLALTPEHGGAYFHGHGRNTGAMWKDFLAQLRREAGSDPAAAARAAVATFDALIAVFERRMA